MEQTVKLTPVVEESGVPWLMWLPANLNESVPAQFDGLRIVAFHYFNRHLKELNKWLDLLDKVAREYAGRIKFGAKDISLISSFFSSLSPDDFGSYRADVPPRLYGIDRAGGQYTMHMFFCYKYIKDFCEKLLSGEMYQALLLSPVEEMDPPAQNLYHIEDECDKDLFIMFYDPACYYWQIQLRRLRKLVKLLTNEEVAVVIVNRGHNYLGVVFDQWSPLSNLHGVTAFSLRRSIDWMASKSPGWDQSAREYLRHIAQRIPDLKDYDREGERRLQEQILTDIRHLYDSAASQ
ncbi:hypothetical protein KR222_002605 [Zaprionus bogoriensis]|nr:hypothetical protein KR222_002605 [Zaprionus bogoriensis]